MFSFIKKLQEFFAKLRKNKGLWFTTISTVSLIGIILSMYIMLTMTKKVSEEVYVDMSDQYRLFFENVVNDFEPTFKKESILILKNKKLLSNLENYDENNLTNLINEYNSDFKSDYKYFSLNIYSAKDQKTRFRDTVNTIFRTKESMFGIEVISDGVFIVSLQPITSEKGEFLGVLELKENIHGIKRYFEENNLEFVFLLHRKMFSKLSLAAKTGKYKDVREKYAVKFSEYNDDFYSKIAEMSRDEFKKFLKQGYWINKYYYMTPKMVMDIGGTDIGLAVIGLNAEDSKGFVKVADNMTKAATSVALGLIISIILFLF